MAPRSRRCATAILMVAAPMAAQHQTTAWEAYQDGLAAQQRGDHRAAAAALRRALELRPAPSARLMTYSNSFIAYFPQVHLANSLMALGDLEGAARALEASAKSGVEPAELRQAATQRLKALQAPRKPAPVELPTPPKVEPVPIAAPAPVEGKALPEPLAQSKAPAPGPAPASPPAPPPKGAATTQVSATKPGALPETSPLRVDGSKATAPAAKSEAVPAPVTPSEAGRPGVVVAGPVSRRLSWLLGAGGVAALFGGLAFWRRRRGGPGNPDRWEQRTMALAQTDPQQVLLHLQHLPADLGPYTLEGVLGQGGFATTYAGFRRSDRLKVAVKVPHAHLLRDADAMTRFRQETALGALLDHPTIVHLVDPAPESGLPWMAMELVEGETLQDHLKRKGRLSIPETVRFAWEIAQALAHAHGKGVVHRDLKPSNVLIAKGHAKVMDFGIARLLDTPGLTGTGLFLGTPSYAAPESIMGSRAGPPADRYALGILIFELLAGHPPFQSDHPLGVMEMHRSTPLPDLAALRPEAPRQLIRLVDRLAAKSPDERPEDPEVLTILADLHRHLEG